MDNKLPSYLQPQKENKKKNVVYGNYDWDYQGYKNERDNYVKPVSQEFKNSYTEYKDFRNAEQKKIPSYLEPTKKSNIFKNMFSDPSKKTKFSGAKQTVKENSYNKYKAENPDTPNFLKPLGYALETPYRIPFTQRLLTKASDFLGTGSYDSKGNKIESMDTGNKIVNGLTDVGGAIIGSAFTGGSGANLLTGTDRLAEYGAGNIAAKTGSKFLGTLSRGAIDAGASTAIEGLAKGKGLKETAKETAVNALGGAALFGLGKGVIEGIKLPSNVSKIQNEAIQNAYLNKFGEPQPKEIKFGKYKTEKPVIEKIAVTKDIQPKTQISGKYKVVNTELKKATQEYEDAIQTIQNHFMTNKLTPEEVTRIKPELGIDINKLADNVANAKTNVAKIAENQRLKATAGVSEIPTSLKSRLNAPTSQTNNISPNISKETLNTTTSKLRSPKIVSSNKADKITIGQKLNKIYTSTVDKNKSISDFSKLANDKTYTLATNSTGQKNIADYIMTDKMVNKKGEVIGKSLKELFQDIPQDKDNSFMNYALEKHNIARANEGKPIFPNRTGEQSAAKIAELEKLHPEWKTKSAEITKWINDFMDEWGVNAGTLDEGLSKANKKLYPDYIPTNRDFSTLEQAGQDYGGANKGFVNQTTPIKRATGSSRDIIDPRENIANMVVRTIKTAKNNEVGQSLLSSIRQNPEKLSKFAEIVAEPKGNVSNIVRVLEKGQPTYIKINDLGLLKAMENLNKTDIGQIEKAAKQVTGAFKSLITQKNPVFAIRNIARDVPTAYVNGSEANPIKFGIDLLSSGKDVLTNSKSFQQYKALGGGGANFFDSGNPSKSINELTGNINPIKKALKTIPNGIEKFNNITESAPRFAEFKRVLNKTGDVDKALFAANDVTTNFARGGDVTKHIDSFTPYLNAGVQGLDKLARQIKDKPLQTLAKGTIAITAPAMTFNYLNKDNENYKNLDNRTKDNYFILPDINNDGKFIKIPKSRELGVLFGSLAERTLRSIQGDKKAFKDFTNTVATNFSPASPVDNNILASAFINLKSNKDFANRAIVPQSMLQDGRSPKYQYDEKTSELAKKLGEVANLSPKQIDYIIKSYTGVIGQMGLPALTKTPGKTPLQNALKPVTSQFVADPLYNNSAINDFYDNLDKLKQAATDKNIIGKLPSKWVTKEETLRNEFTKASKQMSDFNKKISQSSDPKEIEYYRKLIIDLANKTNKMIR